MKTKNLHFALAAFMLVSGINEIKAQTPAPLKTKLIKLVDKNYMGSTDTVDNMPILINTNGNVVVSGNQKINATQYNATTVEQLNTGVQTWINQINVSGEKSFITASCNDGAGNVYNTGAYRSAGAIGLDLFVQKVDNSGTTVWTKFYDNGANDGGIAVCVDPAGNVYTTGASEGGSLIDFVTVAYDAAGNHLWTSIYDHASLIDIPTSILYEPVTDNIVVTGSSANSFTDWDFVTVQYDKASGSQTGEERIPGGVGNDKVFGVVTDSDGNIYSVGSVYNGTDYDVQLTKLDTSLTQVFVKTFDSYGLDDAGVALQLDGNGNIIIVGTSHITPTKTELLILKYDKYGNIVWDKHRPGIGGQASDGLRLEIKSDNEYFVAGNYGVGVNQNVALLCYDSLGYVTIETTYDDAGFRDRLMDMAFDGNHIYLTARTMTSAAAPTEQNLILHYEYTDIIQSVVVAGTSPFYERHVDHEVIISFNKSVCQMGTINDKGMTFGVLNQFVADSTCNKITAALDPDHMRELDAADFPVRKIFFDMTEADSLSESRTGNYVHVPAFYTSLVVTLPNWVNTVGSISPLNTIDQDINYAQLNNVYVLASPPPSTNDPDFSTAQAALHPISPYTSGHINADSAWAMTTGAAHVRVGILDSGIEPGHQDLPANIGGFDFCANSSLANGDADDHGTRVAGTLGAIRNNGIGIAGVAGGDAAANQPGVTMYDMKVTNNGYVSDAWASAGMYKAVAGTNIGGFAQHIATNGYYWAVSYTIKIFGHGVNQLIIDQTNFANRNGVAVLFPKANFANIGTNVFPADWSDETMMSVGSNGFDGEHCSPADNNCSNGSTTWGQIDFLAPGTTQLVKTVSKNGGYTVEDGTSFATPHAAGTAALMMSYRNAPNSSWDNLVHEDIEHLIQRTCTDLVNPTYDEKPGYDTVSGWGRINAYKALQGINKNFYGIRHITETIGSTGIAGAILSPVFTDTMTWTNYPGVPTGTYVTEIWKRTVVINYNLLPSEKIIDKWPLYKECYGTKFDSTYVDGDRPYYGRIDSLSTTACTMTTFYYKIPSLNIHMPYPPTQIKSAFTVYTYDSLGTVGIDKHEDAVSQVNFKVFPNPHQSSFEVEFGSDYTDNLTYKVSNILGQEVQNGNHRATLGVNRIKINSGSLTSGVYILTIFNGSKEIYKQKVIKQE